ncbi:type I pullulanase [Alteribacter keqinensis]|uniref:Type I pullulanase n=1 Tax=Alteribacter keqinensis TaxID=2483800 RepID=A0A3M7TXS1_9BACI|nr:type I pullulanase [Alteribacter keqinensis]RNA70398.1 type I pullulanase [Alteribacter keqinensis]
MEKSVAWIDDVTRLTVNADNIDALLDKTPSLIWEGNKLRGRLEETHLSHTASILFAEPLPVGKEATLVWGDEHFPVFAGSVVRTDWFEDHFTDTHTALGAHYSKDQTKFSVWAPTASNVKLYLNNKYFEMKKSKKGVWFTAVKGDLNKVPYQYEVAINGKIIKVNDPYAKSLTANSKESVVVNLNKTNPDHFTEHDSPDFTRAEDAIIYELHIRDATIDPAGGIKARGKFKGLTEEHTVTKDNSLTGLSYIKELGCSHVQLLPVNDFARVDEREPHMQYNWGYDPLYFQAPEGSYATDVNNPLTRIRECKEMIQSFHNNGLSVILDVVYNHVFVKEDSPFHKLVPGYYFRYHGDGSPGNGTGVGNDLATERKMVRKFILDSVAYWLDEYRVDGFRFDLMGAMDIATMRGIRTLCNEYNRTILLLGEGWDLDTPLHSEQKATMDKSYHLPGVSFFNDFYRDSIKGQLFFMHDAGFANGHGRFIERLPQLVSGSCRDDFGDRKVESPGQSVNYVECHDNHTLWDRLQNTNETETEEEKKRIHQLATGLTLLSQGIPFLHAGQEWFRTKKGDENSYISGDDINKLDWTQREAEKANIQFIKSLINIRREYPVFRLDNKNDIQRRLHILQSPAPVFGYLLLGDSEDIAVFINPTKKRFPLYLPSPGRWDKLISNHVATVSSTSFIIGDHSEIEPYELVVLKKARG